MTSGHHAFGCGLEGEHTGVCAPQQPPAELPPDARIIQANQATSPSLWYMGTTGELTRLDTLDAPEGPTDVREETLIRALLAFATNYYNLRG